MTYMLPFTPGSERNDAGPGLAGTVTSIQAAANARAQRAKPIARGRDMVRTPAGAGRSPRALRSPAVAMPEVDGVKLRRDPALGKSARDQGRTLGVPSPLRPP